MAAIANGSPAARSLVPATITIALPGPTEFAPSPVPSASRPPLPTPDILPAGPAGEYSLAPVSDQAMAHCRYGRAARGQRYLASMEVQPPVVLVDNPRSDTRDVRSLGWRFELQMNRAQSVFHRDWETVARSRLQLAAAVEGRPANFTPLTLRYDAADAGFTAVFRARVIIEWYTRNVELAGRVELVANRYLEANDELDGEWPVYCNGVRLATARTAD